MSGEHEDAGQLDSWDSPPSPPPDPPTSPESVLTLPDHDLRILLARLQGSVRDHQARLSELERFKEVIGGVLDELTAPAIPTIAPADAANPPPEPDTPPDPDEQAPPPRFDLRELVAWVRENVAAVIERKIPQSRSPYWCPRWWQHPEAIARLEAARRSWLEASTEATGNALVVFWEHLDHQLGMLMTEGGTFCNCHSGRHTDLPIAGRRLAHDDPPESVYVDFETAQFPAGVPSALLGTAPGGAATPVGSGGNQVTQHLRYLPNDGERPVRKASR